MIVVWRWKKYPFHGRLAGLTCRRLEGGPTQANQSGNNQINYQFNDHWSRLAPGFDDVESGGKSNPFHPDPDFTRGVSQFGKASSPRLYDNQTLKLNQREYRSKYYGNVIQMRSNMGSVGNDSNRINWFDGLGELYHVASKHLLTSSYINMLLRRV